MSASSYLAGIRASGDDAETFLQGQLTQDIRRLQAERPLWAGYCSPKGRLLAVLRLARVAGAIELELPRALLEPTLKRLRMFVLRSKVRLEEIPLAPTADETQWRRQNILSGVPAVFAETSDHFVPQMVNLDQLGGISFDKGCYTGQEIVARLHYLGNLKKRMFLLRSAAPPAPGSAIYDGAGDGQAIGEVVDGAGEGAGAVISAVLQLNHAQSPQLRLHRRDGAALSLPEAYVYSQNP